MAQATAQGDPTPTTDAAAELVTALFDVVRFARHTRRTDPVEPGVGVVLAAASRLTPARPSEIACDVRLDLSTVSRHLRTLEEHGYLERTDDPDDGRAHRVVTTDTGRQVLHEVIANRAAVLDTALAHWSDSDREQLTGLLRCLADDMAAVDPAPRTTARGR